MVFISSFICRSTGISSGTPTTAYVCMATRTVFTFAPKYAKNLPTSPQKAREREREREGGREMKTSGDCAVLKHTEQQRERGIGITTHSPEPMMGSDATIVVNISVKPPASRGTSAKMDSGHGTGAMLLWS